MLTLLFHMAAAVPVDALPHLEATAAEVSARRELPLLAPIQSASFTEEQLRERIEASLREDYPPEEIRGDTATLVALGFCSPDIDLFTVYRDIFVEQIGGFYDPEEQRLVLVQRPDGDAALEQVVIEHELVHALQDQSFGLATLDEQPFDDSDLETALRSLVEGDASFFNVFAMAGEFVGNISSLPLGDGGAAVRPEPGTALHAAPDILSRTLVFPYVQGAAFVQALHASDGYRAVNIAYRNRPPLSTEQILHPGRYLALVPDWPVSLTLPASPPALQRFEQVDEDTLGELGILSWLEAVGGQQVVGTPLGWGGDRYRTWVHPDGTPAMAWFTTWDTPDDAVRFERAARGVMQVRFGGSWRRDDTLKTRSNESALVRREGVDVVVLMGMERAVARPVATDLLRHTERHDRSETSVFNRPER